MVYIWRLGQILVELKLLCFFQLVRFFCQGASDRDLHKLSSVRYEQPRFVTSFPRRAGSKPNIPEWQIRRACAISVLHLQCFETAGIADLFNFCIQPQTKFLTIQKLIVLRNMLQLQIPPWFQFSAGAEMEKALAPGLEERKGTVLPPPQVTFPGSVSLPRSRSSSRWEGEPCYWELLSGSSAIPHQWAGSRSELCNSTSSRWSWEEELLTLTKFHLQTLNKLLEVPSNPFSPFLCWWIRPRNWSSSKAN